MQYDFDAVINRHNTNSVKWDIAEEVFGEKDILPMWIADMDFRAPEPVINALKKVAEHGVFGYSITPESYYEALIQWMKRRRNWDIQKEWIVFAPGVVPAINMAIKTFAQPGDQVIVQTPAYHLFFPAVRNNRCQVLDNPLRLKGGQYVMDFADLENKMNPRAKIIILCSPHNPVGRVWRKEELKKLGELCIKNNIIVVSDEIHGDLVCDGYKHIPFASISEELANISIICTAASKTFNLPGLKVANIIIPNSELRNRFSDTVTSNGIHSPNIFGMVATEAAYRYGESWLVQLLNYLQENMTFLTKYIEEKIPKIKVIQPQGTFLVWLDFRDIGINPAEVKEFLRKEAKVGLSEGTSFGCEEGFKRMNIGCPKATLEEALRRIEKAISILPNTIEVNCLKHP